MQAMQAYRFALDPTPAQERALRNLIRCRGIGRAGGSGSEDELATRRPKRSVQPLSVGCVR